MHTYLTYYRGSGPFVAKGIGIPVRPAPNRLEYSPRYCQVEPESGTLDLAPWNEPNVYQRYQEEPLPADQPPRMENG